MARYIRDEQSGKVLVAQNASKPEFGITGGHTWQSSEFVIDGDEVTYHYDSTWGQYVYFEVDDVWYKVSNGLADYESPFEKVDGYPRNSSILSRGRELETVGKSELDSFLDENGVSGYSPY